MQSKEVLQPTAFGVDVASDESKTTITTYSRVEEDIFQVCLGRYNDMLENSRKLLQGEVGRISGVRIVFDEIVRERGTQLYATPQDQRLYRSLRKDGVSANAAIEAMRLMGIEPVDRFNYYGRENDGVKKVLPHYHGKRRF